LIENFSFTDESLKGRPVAVAPNAEFDCVARKYHAGKAAL
jgi:hypothetical protein